MGWPCASPSDDSVDAGALAELRPNCCTAGGTMAGGSGGLRDLDMSGHPPATALYGKRPVASLFLFDMPVDVGLLQGLARFCKR